MTRSVTAITEIRETQRSVSSSARGKVGPITSGSTDPLAVMSFGEIAKELGISRQRAIQLYHKGIAKLRRVPWPNR